MSGGEQWTVRRLLTWTRDYLTRADVEESRLAAEVLLGHVLDCERLALYTRFDEIVGDEGRASFRRLILRAAEGEPVAYLTGEKEFYSLAMTVTADVLVPRPETELLVDAALDVARGAGGPVRMWDACTGGGCVAVAAAKFADALAVLATDISPAAVQVARGNVERHGLVGRVHVAEADLLDLPDSAAEMAPFDVITANPPYVSDAEMEQLPAGVKCEPEMALRAGPDGLDFIRRIIAAAPEHLKIGGTLAVEIGATQAEAVYEILNGSGRYERIRLLRDAAGLERVALALARK